MKILVINSGSSLIKFLLINKQEFSLVFDGILERIGTAHSKLSFSLYREKSITTQVEEDSLTHDLAAIGHHVAHGGENFTQPALITKSVTVTIREMIPLAAIHNPSNLQGIDIYRKAFPSIPQIAIFDKAFHQTVLAKACQNLCMKPLKFVATVFTTPPTTQLPIPQHKLWKRPFHSLILLHCSLETVPVLPSLKEATLAVEMYCYRIKKYIGAYLAILGQLETLIFTDSIGNN